MRKNISTILSLVCLLLLLVGGVVGCTKSDSDSDDSSSSSNFEPSGDSRGLTAQCGAVVEGQLVNPISIEKAALVSIEPVATDLVIATLEADFTEIGKLGDKFLVKLQGVIAEGATKGSEQRGMSFLNSRRSGVSFVPAGQQCTTRLSNGGKAFVGQLYRNAQLDSGADASLSEALIEMNSVSVDNNTLCSSPDLVACYQTITPVSTVSSSIINRFLWKPVSERDGRLVILTDAFNVLLKIEGAVTETDLQGEPTNGYGTTARAGRPGCAYGNNVKVSATDQNGDQVLIFGQPSITVPSGCARFQR